MVARFHGLDLDERAFSGGETSPADPTSSVKQAQGLAVGINWYATRQVKLKMDYEHTVFSGGAGTADSISDREDEHLISVQVQLTF